jgi:hypothetical protein
VRTLSPVQARRYRRIHALLWVAPIVLFLACLFAGRYLDEGSSAHLVLALVAIFGAGAGLLAVALYQRWLLRHIDPDPELRSKIVSLSWIRPFGSFWAVRELLDQSVLQDGDKPI